MHTENEDYTIFYTIPRSFQTSLSISAHLLLIVVISPSGERLFIVESNVLHSTFLLYKNKPRTSKAVTSVHYDPLFVIIKNHRL